VTPREFLAEYMNRYRKKYWKAKVNSVVRLFPSSFENVKILDLGCGGGVYSLTTASKGATDITVVDKEGFYVKAARLNLKMGQNVNASGIRGDCMCLPFKEETFDFIICVNVIERVSRGERLLQEASRTLKRGGLLVVTARNATSLNNLKPIRYMRLYSPKLFIRKLMRHGFSVQKHSGAYFIPYIRIANTFTSKPRLSQVIRSFFRKINESLEARGDRSPINKYGWEHAYLCRRQLADVRHNKPKKGSQEISFFS